MQEITKKQKDLLLIMVDSFISNTGSSISKVKEQSQRDEVKEILKESLELSEIIKTIKPKK
jgi:hypothetical protein